MRKQGKIRILRIIIFFSEPELKTKEVQNLVLSSFGNFRHIFFTSYIIAHSTVKSTTLQDYSLKSYSHVIVREHNYCELSHNERIIVKLSKQSTLYLILQERNKSNQTPLYYHCTVPSNCYSLTHDINLLKALREIHSQSRCKINW